MTEVDATLVSVVIPVRNRPTLVVAAIQSVLSQTHPTVEVVVVDDGSTDSTPEVLKALSELEPRVVLVTHLTSSGAQAARNSGIRASSGSWIAFLDSDDRYLPHSVQVRLHEAEVRHVSVVHSEGRRITSAGIDPLYGVPPLVGNVYAPLLRAPGPLFPSILVRRDLLLRIGSLDESVVAFQEWDTSIRLARYAAFGFVPVATFDYDERTPIAISRDKVRSAKGYEQVVGKHWREIARNVGMRGLADHYRTLAALRDEAGDRRGSWLARARAVALWPPNLTRLIWRFVGRPIRS